MANCVYTLYVPNPALVPKPILRLLPHEMIRRYVKKEIKEIRTILETLELSEGNKIRVEKESTRTKCLKGVV